MEDTTMTRPSNAKSKCASLRAQIAAAEIQLAALKQELYGLEQNGSSPLSSSPATLMAMTTAELQDHFIGGESQGESHNREKKNKRWPLEQEEYQRYGRQMIVPQIGLSGQLKLRLSSILIIGAGGLGCPAALYLAGAGVGTLGLADGDRVEPSNLHRQVLHRSRNIGKLKVDSAVEYLKELNPHPIYIAHREHLTAQNAHDIFKHYDLILDCTDNPATRYLISDTSVLLGKPLISASALRTEGQLMVLNNPPQPPGDKTGGPCYRCVFPKPPPADSVVSCADGGILGPVVGIMGVLQALEAIKAIITTPIKRHLDANQAELCSTFSPYTLHLFSAYSTTQFRTIRLRSRRPDCAVCSSTASVSLASLHSGLTDYISFCGSSMPLQVLSPEERILPLKYWEIYHSGIAVSNSTVPAQFSDKGNGGAKDKSHFLIDVRDEVQFGICNLDNSINIPISKLLTEMSTPHKGSTDKSDARLPHWLPLDVASSQTARPIYVICRLGNDSQLAVRRLKELGLDQDGKRFIGDVRGGLRAWKEQVDPEWPEY